MVCVQLEERLQLKEKSANFFEQVIESSFEAIVSADLQGNVLLFNGAAERCYGYQASDVIRHLSVEKLYAPNVARAVMRQLRQAGGRIEDFRTEILDQKGELVPVSLSASLLYEKGNVIGSVGIFTDLRDRIRIETSLETAQEALKIREKQAILAELAGAAAHELNQPLTSVMGYAELLKRQLDRQSSSFTAAEVIVNEAQRMADIVRKIGTITHYETKSYVGEAKILDIDKSSSEGDEMAKKIP